MFRSLRVPSACRAVGSVLHLAVIGIAALCAGCASQQAPSHVAGPTPAAVTIPGVWKVQVEADGLPSQHAPRNRPAGPDDPSEPWSPNYGNASGRADAPAVPASAPKPAAVEPRKPAPIAAAQRIARLDADELIRQAIAAHEMRRPD